MAVVYSPPEEFENTVPRLDFKNLDLARYEQEMDEWCERLAEWCRNQNKGDMVGEIVRFPVADGYAQYMVYRQNKLALIHLPLGDAWQIPEAHARGLRLSDVRDMVAREAKLRELFSRK